MSLEIRLVPNHLTKRENDYMAVVHNVVFKNLNDIIKQITVHGSIMKETECVAVINAYWDAIGENIENGIGFSSRQINITPRAGGVFGSSEDYFDEGRHWKDVTISAGVKLKKNINNMKVKIVRSLPNLPSVKSFFDIQTQTSNQKITPGHMADITGDMLKIQGENAGVFFINKDSGHEFAVERIHGNLPKKLTIIIPEDLIPGFYKLEVRTHINRSKEIRTGTLEAILSNV